MRALFVGRIHSRELEIYSDAWNCWNSEKAHQATFHVAGEKSDRDILNAAAVCSPDVIFYIGSAGGAGIPSPETLRALRSHGKTIHLCCDSTDSPWHPYLRTYAERECFDLQVGLDGPLEAPVDLSTLPPINPARYDVKPEPDRDIRCGFAGQFIPESDRGMIMVPLIEQNVLTVMTREISQDGHDVNPYDDYVHFMRRCLIAFNTCFTAADARPYIKWRVIEAAFAGCALLENEGSTVDNWFPRDAVFHYANPQDAAEIIQTASPEEIAQKAARLSEKARRDYGPEHIYGQMLHRIGLS